MSYRAVSLLTIVFIYSLILARIPGVRDRCRSLGRRGAKAGVFCTVDRQPVAVNPGAGEIVARPGEHEMFVALVVRPLINFSSSTSIVS